MNTLPPFRVMRAYRHVLLPAMLFAALACIPIAVWSLVQSREDLAVRDLTRQYADHVAAQLQRRIETRLRVLDLLSRRLASGEIRDRAGFESLARFQQTATPDLGLLGWVDAAHIMRWAASPNGKVVALGMDISKLATGASLLKAEATRKPTASPPVKMLRGYVGVALFEPVIRSGALLGLVEGVSEVSSLVVPSAESQRSGQFNLRVSDGELALFADEKGESEAKFIMRKDVVVADRTWTVAVAPQTAYVSSVKAPTKELVLAVGLLLSAGVAIAYGAALLGRKRAESERKRFQDFAESGSDWQWELDSDYRFTYVTPQIQSVLGYSAGSLVGVSRRELVWAEDNPSAVMDEWKRLVGEHKVVRNLEAWSRHTSGQRVRIRLNGTPVFDERGRFAGYRGTGTDITGETRAKEALTEAQQRLHDAIEALPAGLFLYDSLHRLVMWNSHIGNFYPNLMPLLRPGMTYAEVARHAADLHYPGTPAERDALVDRWVREFYSSPTNEELHLADGRILRALDWRAGNGSTVCLRFDITEAKRREEELRDVERTLQGAIEGLPASFMLWDAKGRLVMWNSHVREVYGETYEQFRPGMSYEEFAALVSPLIEGTPEEQCAQTERRIALFRSAPNTSEIQLGDGRALRLVNWRTADGATVSIRFDITAEKLRDNELRQAQKMDALGQLTGGIAHDFNNLLTVIIGNTDLLMLKKAEHGEAQALVAMIRSAALRGAELTAQLLAYSRKQALRPQSLDVNRLVLRISEMLQRVLGEHIHIETVLAAGLWPALADAPQLESAILNLAVNARDAMPEGGKLTLETANFRLDEQYTALHTEVTPGQYVLLAVTDTGVGMGPDTIEHAFEPFFTTKEPGKGTGLGLSMVYGFVKQSGGHVKIYSEPGRGTSVKVYLPRGDRAAIAGDAPLAAPTTPMGTETILVVEDEELVRRTAVAQLAVLGYRVTEAPDGASAMALLKGQEAFDLLFTDVVLPGGIMGSELAQQARAIRPSLRVLFTSGYTENAIVHQGTLDSGVQLLTKPYTKDALARKVRSVLDGQA